MIEIKWLRIKLILNISSYEKKQLLEKGTVRNKNLTTEMTLNAEIFKVITESY